MKKIFTGVLFIILAACTTAVRQDQQEQSDRRKDPKRNTYMVDMCDPANMPKFRHRPLKPTAKEIASLSEAQMDERIKAYIVAMDKHVDSLEEVILQTRRRVELCR